MNITSHINLYKRHIKAILFLILVTLITSTSIGFRTPDTRYESTLFISIGTYGGQNHTQPQLFDEIQAADRFTETIQGWFKNPDFINRLNKDLNTKCNCEYSIGLSARKQESQNLIVTYSSPDEQIANWTSDIIRLQLNSEISAYNSQTNANFNIGLFSTESHETGKNMLIYIIIGLICGLILSLFFVYLTEILTGVVSHIGQIERALGVKVDDIIRNKHISNVNLSYISALLIRYGAKDIMLVGIDFLPVKIEQAIKESFPRHNIKAIMFPDDATELSDEKNVITVVVCNIGLSKIESLEKIKPLLSRPAIVIALE